MEVLSNTLVRMGMLLMRLLVSLNTFSDFRFQFSCLFFYNFYY